MTREEVLIGMLYHGRPWAEALEEATRRGGSIFDVSQKAMENGWTIGGRLTESGRRAAKWALTPRWEITVHPPGAGANVEE